MHHLFYIYYIFFLFKYYIYYISINIDQIILKISLLYNFIYVFYLVIDYI